MATAVREPTDEAIKDVLRLFVGNSSARAKKHTCFVIASLGSCYLESSSHNPEVVGSNPAPATRNKIVHHQVGDFIFLIEGTG